MLILKINLRLVGGLIALFCFCNQSFAQQSTIAELYTQRAQAISSNNIASLQNIDKQLIEQDERPSLIYSKVENSNQTYTYKFVAAWDYPSHHIAKMNNRLKNAYPTLIDIVKIDQYYVNVIVKTETSEPALTEIFQFFRYTYSTQNN